jgi:putative transcriptional regulator
MSTQLDVPSVNRMIEFMRENVQNTVQLLRERAGTTQEQLAVRVGVSRQTIIAIEKGNYTPSVLLALKLAHYFKKSVEELFRI